MRVALVTTGQLEYKALGTALKQLFPDVEFVSFPANRGPLDGFTSCLIENNSAADLATTNVRKLVAQMVAPVEPGQPRGGRFDFSFLIDDVELVNDHQPERLVSLVRAAVTAHIRESFQPPDQAAICKRIADKCSFHLLRPMVEAYFFGDPAALTRAKTQRMPQLDPSRDHEQLFVTDPDYLAVPDDNDKLKPHNGGTGDRSRHPKSYLTFLCDPTLTKKRPYSETKEGVAALELLNWEAVVRSAVQKCPFLSAFLEDLSWAVSRPLDWIAKDQTAQMTRMKLEDPNRTLRNI